MANAGLAPYPKYRSVLADGYSPNAGGKVYFYVAGTSTPKDTQVSRTGANNANPVILDSIGEADVWYLSGTYKIVETTSSDVQLRTADNVSSAGDLPTQWTASGSDIYYNSGKVIIGSTSGGETLTVDGTASVSGLLSTGAGITLGDNDAITLGDGGDATITYNGSHMRINPDAVGSGWLIVDGVCDITGNAGVSGDLAITGNTINSGTLTVTGLITANGGVTLGAGDSLIGSSTSNITINTNMFTVAGATGNTVVGGTLGVTGNSTFAGTATFTGLITANGGVTLGAGDSLIGSSTSDITINTNKFTVAGATGNTVVGGTLDIAGNTNIGTAFAVAASSGTLNINTNKLIITGSDGSLNIGPDKFTVAGATGNTVIDGTLTVVGAGYFSASTTARSSIRIPHGTAPTSPQNGDMWTTTAGIYIRINGSTVGPLT